MDRANRMQSKVLELPKRSPFSPKTLQRYTKTTKSFCVVMTFFIYKPSKKYTYYMFKVHISLFSIKLSFSLGYSSIAA